MAPRATRFWHPHTIKLFQLIEKTVQNLISQFHLDIYLYLLQWTLQLDIPSFQRREGFDEFIVVQRLCKIAFNRQHCQAHQSVLSHNWMDICHQKFQFTETTFSRSNTDCDSNEELKGYHVIWKKHPLQQKPSSWGFQRLKTLKLHLLPLLEDSARFSQRQYAI